MELDGDEAAFFSIPASVILDDVIGDRLVTVFSFFSIARGLDMRAAFSLNYIAQWSGRKPDRHAGGLNDKIKDAIARLESDGYVSIDGRMSNAGVCVATLDRDSICDRCATDRFAIVYLDEVRKILEWRPNGRSDACRSCDALLRVFAYLRMSIRRRRNALFPEEMNVDDAQDHWLDVESRRRRSPDAYNGYYCDIADELGMTSRAVSRAVDVLCELGLLYAEPLPRTKVNGRWKTTHTIFCNAYKREGRYLLDGGSDYYLREVANKRKVIDALF